MDRVITISRQHGSGGRQIGRLSSEKLNIPFYDKEIIAHAAEQSGIHGSHFDLADQSDMSGPAYLTSPEVAFELPLRDKVYLAQRSAILEIASKGPCVIVGRGAGEVLNGKVPLCVSLFTQTAEQGYNGLWSNTMNQRRQLKNALIR